MTAVLPASDRSCFYFFRGVNTHNYLYAHNKRGAAAGGGTWFHGIFWWPLNSMTTAPWMDARLGCHCPAAILIPHYPPKFSCGWIISQRPLSTLAVYCIDPDLLWASRRRAVIYYITLFIFEWQLTFDRAWRFHQVNHTALRERGGRKRQAIINCCGCVCASSQPIRKIVNIHFGLWNR